MRKLTKTDWDILRSFTGPIIDREQIFAALQLRANFEEIKELLASLREEDDPKNRFNIILNRFPHSMSYEEQEEIYRIFLLEDWHHEHGNMVKAFQRYFNRSTKNIEVLLKRMNNVPEFYRYDMDLKNPFIRKCTYAIAAQPEPNNIDALTKLSESNDEVVRGYAQHQLEKIADKKGEG